MKRLLLASLLAAALLSAEPLSAAGTYGTLIDRGPGPLKLWIRGDTATIEFGGRLISMRGAIGARHPSPSPQVRYEKNYRALRPTGLAAVPVAAPGVPMGKAYRAKDGSYWAVQRWRRLVPNYGGDTTSPLVALENHVSHWSGPVARFSELVWDVHGNGIPRLAGRLTYQGQGIHGFKTTSQGNPLDAYGRNIYMDALDSNLGPGWHRVNSFVAQQYEGRFRYMLWNHLGNGDGLGATRYRLTAQGPGVTPIIRVEVLPPVIAPFQLRLRQPYESKSCSPATGIRRFK